MTDVSIECSTPWVGVTYNARHATVMIMAAVTIAVYPIGLFVLNAVLLFRARNAIISGKPTPLSRSIHFLYKEYEPWAFWCAIPPQPACHVPALAVDSAPAGRARSYAHAVCRWRDAGGS